MAYLIRKRLRTVNDMTNTCNELFSYTFSIGNVHTIAIYINNKDDNASGSTLQFQSRYMVLVVMSKWYTPGDDFGGLCSRMKRLERRDRDGRTQSDDKVERA